MRTRVVVLAEPSLFTEGVATRLKKHLDQIELEIIDSRKPDALQKAIAAQPAVVLMEADDTITGPSCPLADLLVATPTVRILRLDPSRDRIQVMTSEQRTLSDPSDLIGMVLAPA
ncbi:MAG TPA: hypothetical protein VFI11_11320 [Anaerolineales bacterium]|nr:hypothetical protein [Anaerolineales bacterium]